MSLKKVKNFSIYTLSLFLLGFGMIESVQAQQASSILEKAASVYEDSKGLTVIFTMQSRSEAQAVSESFDGTLDIRGECFVLKIPGMITWFDGTTQWSYVEHTEEVNVTNPTGEELQMTNPALLLRSYKKGFTASYRGETTAPNGKAAYCIELKPKKKSDITRVELLIEKYANLPASISVFAKNGLCSTVRINQIKRNVNQPEAYFRFQETAFPDVEVIDLR